MVRSFPAWRIEFEVIGCYEGHESDNFCHKNVVLNHNDYGAPCTAKEATFIWFGQEKVGMNAWRNASEQDAASTFTTRK